MPRVRLSGIATLGATVTPCGAHRVGFTLPSSGSSAHRPAPRGFCHGSPRTRAGDGYPSGAARPHPLSLSLAAIQPLISSSWLNPDPHRPNPASGHSPYTRRRQGTAMPAGPRSTPCPGAPSCEDGDGKREGKKKYFWGGTWRRCRPCHYTISAPKILPNV